MSQFYPYPITQINPNGTGVLQQTFREKINEIMGDPTNPNPNSIIAQIKDIQVPSMPGPIEKRMIAENYVLPELFILNSKLYQAYVKRNNLIFSYLQNHEDFYRMSEFYLSHENPSIRSINKLLRDNQTKSVDNAAAQWIDEMKILFEKVQKLQTENETKVFPAFITFIQNEIDAYQQKST